MAGLSYFSDSQSPNSNFPTLGLTLRDLGLGLRLGISTQGCQYFIIQRARHDCKGVIMKFSRIKVVFM